MIKISNGSILTNSGKKILLNRAYKSSPDYTVPSNFKVGISNSTPDITDTDLDVSVPILNGTTLDDGSNTMTGSSGGDNSTDNITTYKQGGGNSDVTAQNLIANDTNATKIWTIADLSSAGNNATGTSFFSMWLYIKDATSLAKFKTSGTTVEFKLGSSAANYYSKTFTASDLAVGWNYLETGTTAINGLTETGTVAGDIDTFIIEITTNNATDTFVAGDVIYDLARQWVTSDLKKTFVTSYPSINETNNEVEIRCQILSTNANGFLINGFWLENTDGTILGHSEDTFTDESKSDTDQFTFIIKDRIE